MVTQYIATQPIMDLCNQSTWQPGARLYQRWWEHSGIDLEGAKKRAVEAATVSESESYSDSGRKESSRASGAEWSGAEK